MSAWVGKLREVLGGGGLNLLQTRSELSQTSLGPCAVPRWQEVLGALSVLELSWILVRLTVCVWAHFWPVSQRCCLVKLPQLVAIKP